MITDLPTKLTHDPCDPKLAPHVFSSIFQGIFSFLGSEACQSQWCEN